nr:glutamate-5-semialdehyde dehydrogenase [Anaerotignum sp.]
MMSILSEMGQKAKDASVVLSVLSAPKKNEALCHGAEALLVAEKEILAANQIDVEDALASGIKGAFIDRLTLTHARLQEMAEGLRQVAALDDPVGEVLSMKTLDNGLIIGQKRVPMGVIGIIFEARPNVTADAFGLCLKAGSAVILRGGKEAFRTNQAVVSVFRKAMEEVGLPADIVQVVPDTSRETANEMMRLNGYLDVLIPRGGAGLIQSVVQNSTVPVIETGVGNCHIFVDETADLDKAVAIVLNAKTQRPGVCNACESLLVHEKIAERFLPMVGKALQEKAVEIRGDEATCSLISGSVPAVEEDWATEFTDYIISTRVVNNFDDAITHIRKYSTGHSEAILTENYSNAQRFLNEVDAAAVYVNASTRFTDGGQFGFGAEIGISTQKLHARGPMGLKELTTTKYIIYGNGQIRQ